MWSDSRLKDLSIESKNTGNRLRTRKLWSFEVGASYEQQLTCKTDRHLMSFVFFKHHMSLDYIEPSIYEFQTQRAFRRVYEHVKRTSDEKVMIVQSWYSRARSLLSSARRAQSKEVSLASHSFCRRAQQKRLAHAAHAEKFMQLSTRGQLMHLMQESSCSSCSSCKRAHSAHAEELMQLMQKSSCSSCRRAHAEELMQLMQKSSCNSCRRAHATHAGELMHLSTRGHLRQLMQESSCSSCRRAHAEKLSSDQRGRFG